MPLLAEPVPYCAFLFPHMQGLPACAIPGRITTTQHRTISPGLISTCTPLKIRQAPQLLLHFYVCPLPFPHPSSPSRSHSLPAPATLCLGSVRPGSSRRRRGRNIAEDSDDSLTPGHDLRRYIASSKSLECPDCIFTRARGPLPNRGAVRRCSCRAFATDLLCHRGTALPCICSSLINQATGARIAAMSPAVSER